MNDSLIERLAARSKEDRICAANSGRVLALMQPELDKFNARTECNTYAVRLAVEHRNSAKRDTAFADDLDDAIATLSAAPAGCVVVPVEPTLEMLFAAAADNGWCDEDMEAAKKDPDGEFIDYRVAYSAMLAAAPNAPAAVKTDGTLQQIYTSDPAPPVAPITQPASDAVVKAGEGMGGVAPAVVLAWRWNQGGELVEFSPPDEHNAWKWTPLCDATLLAARDAEVAARDKFHLAGAIEIQLLLDAKTLECESAQDALRDALAENTVNFERAEALEGLLWKARDEIRRYATDESAAGWSAIGLIREIDALLTPEVRHG